MNFELTPDQRMMAETFARFMDERSSSVHIRAAADNNGFDAELWQGLAELGAFSLRVPEGQGGLGLGIMDAAVLMEEAGRTLVSGPLAETLVATRVLALLAEKSHGDLLEAAIMGNSVLSIAYHNVAEQKTQWVAGGAVADAVIARDGDQVALYLLNKDASRFEKNLSLIHI